MVTEAGVDAPGRSETTRGPHSCQMGARERHRGHVRPSTRHPRTAAAGSANLFQDVPPATGALLLAAQPTTSRSTSRPDRPRSGWTLSPSPPRSQRSVDAAGGVVRARGRGERDDVSAPCAQVLPCVQRPDHDALIATITTNPPSSAAAHGTLRPAVMEPQPWLSTAFLHPTHLGVFHVEHAPKRLRSR
jgi:hypothetical protein